MGCPSVLPHLPHDSSLSISPSSGMTSKIGLCRPQIFLCSSNAPWPHFLYFFDRLSKKVKHLSQNNRLTWCNVFEIAQVLKNSIYMYSDIWHSLSWVKDQNDHISPHLLLQADKRLMWDTFAVAGSHFSNRKYLHSR